MEYEEVNHDLDYSAIGLRIRKYRLSNQLSQDKLAELIGISTTHMSHIETGSTKLSLPVLVRIASVLSISTDELLREKNEKNENTIQFEIFHTIEQCSTKELLILSEIVNASVSALHTYS